MYSLVIKWNTSQIFFFTVEICDILKLPIRLALSLYHPLRHITLMLYSCQSTYRFALQGFLPHHIGFVLEGGIVVDGHAVDVGGRRDATGHLLGYVPSLVREVFLLAGGDVDVGPLRICKGLHGGGLATVVMDPDIVQGESGKALDTGLQVVRQAGLIFPGPIRTIIHNADRPRRITVLLNDTGILRLTTSFRFHIFYYSKE